MALVVPAQSFLVDKKSRLLAGTVGRANAWGTDLAKVLRVTSIVAELTLAGAYPGRDLCVTWKPATDVTQPVPYPIDRAGGQTLNTDLRPYRLDTRKR